MKKHVFITTLSILCLTHSKAAFGMNKPENINTLTKPINMLMAQITITGEKQHHNEWGHPNGYWHQLINPEGEPVLECVSYSDVAPAELIAQVLDEDSRLIYGWKIRSTLLGYN